MVLAVESATELAGVALADEAGVLATATVSRGRHHAESIAPAIEFVCRRAGVALSALDAVGVDVGPGLFTGLRVGVGTAKALAFALDRPLVTVGSLEVLAHAVATAGVAPGTLVVPVVDARRGEVFVGRLRATAGGVAWEEGETRRTPEALAAELSEGRAVRAGRQRGASVPGDTGRRAWCGDGGRNPRLPLSGGVGHAGAVARRWRGSPATRPPCSPSTCATRTPASTGRRGRGRAGVGT